MLTPMKEDFLPEAGFEMYYYDQLGCCNSDVPEDKSDMTLWTCTFSFLLPLIHLCTALIYEVILWRL